MNFLRSKNWLKKLTIFLLTVTLYFLLIFLFFYLTDTPSYECTNYANDSFGVSGRIPCSLISASNFVLFPFFVFNGPNTANLLAGFGLIIWFIATIVYIVLFFCIYTLVLYVHKK